MHGNAEPARSEDRHGGKDAQRDAAANSMPTPVRRADHRFGQYEIKFLLGEATAELVKDWARVHMSRDPVAACDERELYPVHSVYLDTPALGVFGRAGALRTRKYRLRRYGNEDTIWLERKAKVRGRVKKRRTAISESELACVYQSAPPEHWSGHWFRRRVALRQLQPVCSVTYERFARVGLTPEGPIRMTLDRAIGGCGLRDLDVNTWDVPRGSLEGLQRLSGLCILELKYPTSLPSLFKGIMSDFALEPLKVSKFRTCMQTWVVPGGQEEASSEDGDSRAVA
ncbi:polyphosphate polymerase domain-containing protein [Anatilimnocola floriformis]|uniref:polyphosphate polymerase domain-containing protein n=1 Tax=Anatilimnocola floriformis TaxID=2948575 RepID=UPI0020C33F16|nr:polyphosphate polymerase domain-containing protein [Anatilimnocola floriformis]